MQSRMKISKGFKEMQHVYTTHDQGRYQIPTSVIPYPFTSSDYDARDRSSKKPCVVYSCKCIKEQHCRSKMLMIHIVTTGTNHLLFLSVTILLLLMLLGWIKGSKCAITHKSVMYLTKRDGDFAMCLACIDISPFTDCTIGEIVPA